MKRLALTLSILLTSGCVSSYYEYMYQVEELDQQIRQQKHFFKQCKKICGRSGVKACAANSAEIECQTRSSKKKQ